MANRNGRVKALIARNIMDILTFELKNRALGLPSVNEVDVNSDNSLAKIYVSFLGSKNPKKNLEELNRCKGYIRSSLAKKMDVYKVPELLFIYDSRFDEAEHLDAILKKEEEEIENAKKGMK
ncbi:MAG TPA: 30S ribosome-binding factor RbfA [Firmicutes bacterium]|nr:30S ribosome-binding factor RbfA [Bacillota bacterium]